MGKAIGKEFIEKTKYPYLTTSKQQQGVPQPPLTAPFEGEGEPLDLPTPGTLETPLRKVIEARATIRNYAEQTLSMEELAYLLWCTQGVKRVVEGHATYRVVPSAGARHALETYLLVNRVEGLARGLYRYRAVEHKLAAVMLSDTLDVQIARACLDQESVLRSAATFLWVCVVERMAWRYAERGYRYIFLDAGHVCQNLYLAAESIGCGVCAIGAYDDDQLNDTLALDGEEAFVIYLATVGKKKRRAT